MKKRASARVSLCSSSRHRQPAQQQPKRSLPLWFSLAARASYINPPVRGMTGLVTRLLNTPHSRVMHSLFASLTRKLAECARRRERKYQCTHAAASTRSMEPFISRGRSTSAEKEKSVPSDVPMRKSLTPFFHPD